MAKKSLINKANRTPKFAVRQYKRCRVCGRARGYLRKFAMCRICFRGYIPTGRDSRRGKVKLVVSSGKEIRCGVAYL